MLDSLELITNNCPSSKEENEPGKLPDLPSLKSNIDSFYERRKCRSQQKLKKIGKLFILLYSKISWYFYYFIIEFINNCDKEILDTKYSIGLQRKCTPEIKLLDTKIFDLNDKCDDTLWSREEQIQFAYNLMDIESNSSIIVLRQILNNLLNYEKLKEFEMEFLIDFWEKTGMIFCKIIK